MQQMYRFYRVRPAHIAFHKLSCSCEAFATIYAGAMFKWTSSLLHLPVMFLLMVVWPTASFADPQTQSAVQTTWRLLDYVAVDYPGAVQNGRVVSASEFAEMREFTTTVGNPGSRMASRRSGISRLAMAAPSGARRYSPSAGRGADKINLGLPTTASSRCRCRQFPKHIHG